MIRQRPFALMFLVFLLTAFCLPPSAFSQSATATLNGTVEDTNGAVIPGANVTVENVATRLRRQAKTSESGLFTVPLLPPGEYTLTVESQGFAPVKINNVVLNVGDQKSLEIQLKAGDISAQVQVINEASLINTSPAVATTIDRTFVGNLPLNGRSFQSLILLTPGVTVASGGTDLGQFSVNGQRASTNSFIVDGVSANIGSSISGGRDKNLSLAGSYPGLSAFGGTNNLVSVDALEEFKIQTSTYSAEFGRQPGGQVSLITRSGTNGFHGSLFEYFRNDALDARNYFNPKPLPQTALRQNQFGGTFSGPVYFPNFGDGGPSIYNGKDRTFFFFSYEGQRLRLPTSGIVDVPSQRLRDAANVAVKPILNAFPTPTGAERIVTCVTTSDPFCSPTPDPNDPPTQGTKPSGFAPWNFGVSNPGTLDSTGIRIDHALNSKTLLFGRYNDSPSDSISGNFTKFRNIARTRTLTIGVTSAISSKLHNEFRINYSKQHEEQQRYVLGGIPVENAVLTNGMSGVGFVNFAFSGNNIGIVGGDFIDSVQRSLNVTDGVSLINGNHNLKFGIDFRQLSPVYGPQAQQSVTFSTEGAVISATASTVSIFNIDSARPQYRNFSAYGQDDWKASTRLLLSFGLRWEFNPPPTERNGKYPPVVTGITGTNVQNATLAPPGTPFYKTFWTAFAPRFGFAYQLRRKPGQETVIRGGFGVYYDLGSGTATNGFPISASRSLTNRPYPLSAEDAMRPPVTIPTSLPITTLVSSNDPDLKLPFTMQWNAAVEQSFGSRQVVSISYVASAGRRLLTTQNLNVGRNFGPAPNPNFGQIGYTFNGPKSDYHSMQAQYRIRLRESIQALLNYTWSHAIDDSSSDVLAAVLDRGSSNFDVRHNFSGAVSYNFARLKSNQILGFLFNGWSIDVIAHAQSGRPIDVFSNLLLFRPDGTFFSLRPDLLVGVPIYLKDHSVPGGRRFNPDAFTNPPIVAGAATRQGTLGRNVLRELPIYQFDLGVRRTFGLSERIKLQLKAEAFNVFNHPMFGRYGDRFTTRSTFGVPQTTLNNALGGLNLLYQLGGPRSIQLSARVSF